MLLELLTTYSGQGLGQPLGTLISFSPYNPYPGPGRGRHALSAEEQALVRGMEGESGGSRGEVDGRGGGGAGGQITGSLCTDLVSDTAAMEGLFPGGRN